MEPQVSNRHEKKTLKVLLIIIHHILRVNLLPVSNLVSGSHNLTSKENLSLMITFDECLICHAGKVQPVHYKVDFD